MSDKTQNQFYGLLKESLWPLVTVRADIKTKRYLFFEGRSTSKTLQHLLVVCKALWGSPAFKSRSKNNS